MPSSCTDPGVKRSRSKLGSGLGWMSADVTPEWICVSIHFFLFGDTDCIMGIAYRQEVKGSTRVECSSAKVRRECPECRSPACPLETRMTRRCVECWQSPLCRRQQPTASDCRVADTIVAATQFCADWLGSIAAYDQCRPPGPSRSPGSISRPTASR